MRLEYLLDGSPDCPLIRLYGFDATTATRLLRLVAALAEGSVSRIDLDELDEVTSVNGCQLAFVAGRSDQGVVKIATSNQFECVLTRASWSNVYEINQ